MRTRRAIRDSVRRIHACATTAAAASCMSHAARRRRRAGVSLPGLVAWPLMLVGVGGLVWGAYCLGGHGTPTQIVSAGPRIDDIRQIAQLAVLRVKVADVIEGTNAGARAVVLVLGDADMVVDLDKIQIVQRDEQARTATVSLPAPRPDRPRLDHERTRIYEVHKTGLAAFNPLAQPQKELLQDCMRAAQTQVEKAVGQPEFVEQAKQHAELLLSAYHRELGWDVQLRWE